MTYEIRHARAEDAQAIFDIFSSMHLVRGTMRLPHLRFSEMEKRLAPPDGTIQLVAETGGKVIGFIELINHPALFRHKHAAEINMVAVHKAWLGKGVASALMAEIINIADNWMNIHRIGLSVWETNEEATALYKKFGFEAEGRLRDFVFRDGEYVDAIVMGRIRPPSTA